MIPGQTLGGFEVRRRLGKGGVGDVYLAFDTHLRRDVAIKALRPEFAHDPAFVQRFVGEAQNLARLNHPNIATLYSLHNDGRELCMVMEYIDGQTLDEIAAACPLSEADAVAIAAQAMEGLRYAHAMGLIHRDIKPGNLMINRAGTLKIMDFGIARLQGSERMTRQGAIIGSIAYMAPEQILGREGDERSDIYSLAIVLYELLCGAPPFAGDSEYAVMKAQIETTPRRLFEHLPAIDPDLEAALMKALAKAPEERFPTVDDFHTALAPVMITTFDATRRLNGRFAGRRDVREVDPAERSAGSAPGTRLFEAPPPCGSDGSKLAAPALPGTRLQHPSALINRGRQSRSDLWPRLALAAAVTASLGIVAVLSFDMITSERGAPPDPGLPAMEPAVARTEADTRPAAALPVEIPDTNDAPPPPPAGDGDPTAAGPRLSDIAPSTPPETEGTTNPNGSKVVTGTMGGSGPAETEDRGSRAGWIVNQ